MMLSNASRNGLKPATTCSPIGNTENIVRFTSSPVRMHYAYAIPHASATGLSRIPTFAAPDKNAFEQPVWVTCRYRRQSEAEGKGSGIPLRYCCDNCVSDRLGNRRRLKMRGIDASHSDVPFRNPFVSGVVEELKVVADRFFAF
jgi:hypothetical protein